jgi:hypothetical protein
MLHQWKHTTQQSSSTAGTSVAWVCWPTQRLCVPCRLDSDNKQLRLIKLRMEQELAEAGSAGAAAPVGRGLPGSTCDTSPSRWRYQDTPGKAGRSPHKPALQQQQQEQQERERAHSVPRSPGLRSDAGPASQPLPEAAAAAAAQQQARGSSRPSRMAGSLSDTDPVRAAAAGARLSSGEAPVVIAQLPGDAVPGAAGAAGAAGGSRRVTGSKAAALELAGKIAQQVAPSSSVHSTIDALIHEIEMQCQRQERMKAQQKVLLGMIVGGVPPAQPGPTQ